MVNSLKIISAILAIYGAGFLTGSIVDWSPLPHSKVSVKKDNDIQDVHGQDQESIPVSQGDATARPDWMDRKDKEERGRRGPRRGWSPDPAKMANDFVQNLDAKLDLSSEQETQLLNVFQESHERMKSLREELDPKMKAEFHRVHEMILESLNEAQKEAYLKDLETNRWNRGRRPPPPQSPDNQ